MPALRLAGAIVLALLLLIDEHRRRGVRDLDERLRGLAWASGEGADGRESKSDLESNLSYERLSSLGPFVGEPSRRFPREFKPAQACHGGPELECR